MSNSVLIHPFNVVILIADNFIDNYVHRRLLESLNVSRKYMEFSTPDEAINYLKIVHDLYDKSGNNSIDLIILDESIKKTDIREFIEKYNILYAGQESHSKIIILSEMGSLPEMERFDTEKSVIGYIQKPLNDEKIIHCLKNIPGIINISFLN